MKTEHSHHTGWAGRTVEGLGLEWPGEPPAPRSAVVGVDGSPESLDALRWAIAIAAEIHLVSAIDAYRTSGDFTGPTFAYISRMREDAQRAIDAVGPLLHGRAHTEHVADFSPAAAILGRAEAVGADIIVVGASSKGALNRILLGATAESVAHRARCSVLVCRDRPHDGPVVGGVGSDAFSAYAAAWTVALARWLRQAPVLAQAVPAVAKDELATAGLSAVSTPPRKGLAEFARQRGATAIVVGHSGRPAWLGSQALSLVRHAPCSVLVARPWSRHEFSAQAG